MIHISILIIIFMIIMFNSIEEEFRIKLIIDEDENQRRENAIKYGVYLPLDMDGPIVKTEPITPPISPVSKQIYMHSSPSAIMSPFSSPIKW